jgi:NAD(P)-dependent dehydrogenase (short-subunit alcohol dehydrogenase family)
VTPMGTSGGFEGRVAVVTGGASGIGLALAERLCAERARVAILDLSDGAVLAATQRLGEAPGGTERPGRVLGLAADVTDEEGLRAALEQVESTLGPVELYFSNAGIGGGLGLGTDEEWARTWAVHGMAHVYAARAVLPGMAARGTGEFVVTASAAGLLMMMQSAPYTVTKHASVAIAEWLAVEYGDRGVGVHCLAPQGVRTPMVSSDARAEAEVAASGKIIQPAEVADAVLAALRRGDFLIMPHPEVQVYEQAKITDRTKWLRTMRRLRARL